MVKLLFITCFIFIPSIYASSTIKCPNLKQVRENDSANIVSIAPHKIYIFYDSNISVPVGYGLYKEWDIIIGPLKEVNLSSAQNKVKKIINNTDAKGTPEGNENGQVYCSYKTKEKGIYITAWENN